MNTILLEVARVSLNRSVRGSAPIADNPATAANIMKNSFLNMDVMMFYKINTSGEGKVYGGGLRVKGYNFYKIYKNYNSYKSYMSYNITL